MAGLVGYASSDEESEVEQQSPPQARPPSPEPSKATQYTIPDTTSQPPPHQNEPQPTPAQPAPLRSGPVGPSLPPMATAGPEPQPQPQPQDQETPLDDGVNAPSSPYSTNRSLLHDLTLPSIPNFDIPPSPPPGSPSASSSGAAAATSKKFEQFLQLKKKGTHFNAKLEQSAALRNPALTDKLLAFVDLAAPGRGGSGSAGKSPPDARAVEQYTTTLPADVWDPGAFPDWAFRDRLRRTRETVAKEREAARSAPGRSAVEFVAASGAAGGASRSSTESPGSGARGEKRKSDWK